MSMRLEGRILLACLLAAACVAASAREPDLERLFEQGRHDRFFAQAHERALQDDAAALFLLGKAYHLGRGVEADEATARLHYQRARSLGSARASHNLGMMALEAGEIGKAIDLLEEALGRGLKTPTLYNLGRAHTPPEALSRFRLPAYIDGARTAASYYVRACEEAPGEDCREDAARQYVRAYLMALGGGLEQEEMADLREQALVWLRKGMEAGSGVSWTNYGALLLNDRDYVAAWEAFQQGAQRQQGVAHFHLGEMAGQGLGREARDRKLALSHYQQAAELGVEPARRKAFDLLLEQLESEDDPAALEHGIERLRALQPEPAYGEWKLGRIADRVRWGRFLAGARQALPALPPQAGATLLLDACDLGLNQSHGAAYNIGSGSRWRLGAFTRPGRIERLSIRGEVDDRGCAHFEMPVDDELYALLQQRALLVLSFPNYDLPLSLSRRGSTLALALRPVGTPLPAR